MAGIYLHIPFCKKACHYCDFHFSTSLRQKGKVVNAIQKELILRKPYLNNQSISTIYFGGGTPSTLSSQEINQIFNTLYSHYSIEETVEITLEANPDDLTHEKLKELKATPINRLSIGIQSFRPEDLEWMNRAHNAQQALECVQLAKQYEFENITIDLIYGIPNLPNEAWLKNLETAFSLDINHISAYCLTVEQGTALGYQVAKRKQEDIDESQASKQFEIMLEQMKKHGFEQYEISNFARNQSYSKHNSNYWNKTHYLGIGPSAHSFNGTSREWNIANNKKYVDSIREGIIPSQKEELDLQTQYNEYILTSLRTIWGINLTQIKENYGEEIQNFLLNSSNKFISSELLTKKDNRLTLTGKGKLFADKIASDLFILEE